FKTYLDIVKLKSSIIYLSSGAITLRILEENIIKDLTQRKDIYSYPANTEVLLQNNINNMNQAVYGINYLNNLYYRKDVSTLTLSKTNEFLFIFNNGMQYKKENVPVFAEIVNMGNRCFLLLNNYRNRGGDQNVTN